jgi:hypothetical protein
MRQELPSGAYIEITPLSYEQAWDVAQSLLREVQKLDVNIEALEFDEKDQAKIDPIAFKGPICGILSSPIAQNAVKLCFTRCLYIQGTSQAKIDKDTFEPVERRGDFLFCAYYALKENVYPFFGSLVSLLRAR